MVNNKDFSKVRVHGWTIFHILELERIKRFVEKRKNYGYIVKVGKYWKGVKTTEDIVNPIMMTERDSEEEKLLGFEV